MNVKTLVTLVGSLSLGALASGCATTSQSAPAMEKTAEHSCGGKAAEASCGGKTGEASCSGKASQAAPTDAAKATEAEKGGHAGCGANGCGGPAK